MVQTVHLHRATHSRLVVTEPFEFMQLKFHNQNVIESIQNNFATVDTNIQGESNKLAIAHLV